MTWKYHNQHDNHITLFGWVYGLIYRETILISKDQEKYVLFKNTLFFLFFPGHFEWLEANDNALYKSAYLNSSMCHCSSKNCHFQFHYSMADSSVLKVVLFTNQVRRNMHSFWKGKAQVLPAKTRWNMPASTCLSPKTACVIK